MTVRSSQLAFGVVAAAADTTVYTVHAGYRTIIRSIVLSNASGSGVEYSTSVLKSGVRAYLDTGTVPAGSVQPPYQTWTVLMPGDTLQLAPGTAAQLRYIVSGAELLL